ncbi:GntR family transcriptional regulator [Reyranella sp.]|uniref:GntR family transcriptional regulator n=1 Tax=Reyranella sp. TaxID=1929291 RepID=UPI003C7BEB33
MSTDNVIVPAVRRRKPTYMAPSLIATEIAQILSDQIVYLQIAPGARIHEEEVGENFGVSRSPVREVFRMLEADGLVIRAARKGVRVTPMSRRDLDEVYACRSGLEGVAAAQAARHLDKKAQKTIEANLAAMKKAFKANDVPTFFKYNVAFTRSIHVASQNQTLIRVVAGIEKQALRYRYLAHLQSKEMLSMSLEGHGEVAEAVIARDATLARRRAEQLMRRAHGVLARALEQSAYAIAGDTDSLTFES